MNKGEIRDLCRRWAKKGAPPAYLVCASYAALMGNQNLYKNNSADNFANLFKVMNEETEDNTKVKEFFEGLSKTFQIIKHREE